jgi:hypothetical protein
LKQAVDEYDSSMFERFHQSMCRDPVAKRLLQQHRLFKKEKISPVAPLGDKEKKDNEPPFRRGGGLTLLSKHTPLKWREKLSQLVSLWLKTI